MVVAVLLCWGVLLSCQGCNVSGRLLLLLLPLPGASCGWPQPSFFRLGFAGFS